MIGGFMKLAAGTLRTRVRGRRERPADLVTNVIRRRAAGSRPSPTETEGGSTVSGQWRDRS